MSNKKNILLIADNRHSKNWGCRATSLALINIYEEADFYVKSLSECLGLRDNEIGIPINLFPRLNDKRRYQKSLYVYLNKLFKTFGLINYGYKLFDIRSINIEKAASKLFKIAQRGKDPIATKIIDEVKKTDAIVINGEGEAIFTTPPRYTFLFVLLIMEVAKRLSKPIHYVNAIFAPCPKYGWDEETVKKFQSVTEGIPLIALRDKESLQFANEKGVSSKNLEFIPDALFSLKKMFSDQVSLSHDNIPLFDLAGPPENRISNMPDLQPGNYITISGASTPPSVNRKEWAEWFSLLITKIKNEINMPVVLVQTCSKDEFLESVSQDKDIPLIPVKTNISGGVKILSNSALYITGRYHPAIMASFGGTPAVLLESNSHKTRSLAKLLGWEPKNHKIASSEKVIDEIIECIVSELKSKKDTRKKVLSNVEQLQNLPKELPKYI